MLIDERDESGALVATYVSSKSGKGESETESRTDVIVTSPAARTNPKVTCKHY